MFCGTHHSAYDACPTGSGNASFFPFGSGQATTQPDIVDQLATLHEHSGPPPREIIGRAIGEIKRLRREKFNAEAVIHCHNAFLDALESWDKARKK
jgi:hypothetical protein